MSDKDYVDQFSNLSHKVPHHEILYLQSTTRSNHDIKKGPKLDHIRSKLDVNHEKYKGTIPIALQKQKQKSFVLNVFL